MDTRRAIKLMLSDADMSSRDLGPAMGMSKAVAASKLTAGIVKIKDLLTIAQACGARVDITLASGAVLPLTLEQAAEDKPAEDKPAE